MPCIINLRATLVTLAVAGALAGCGGAATTPLTPSNALLQTTSQKQAAGVIDDKRRRCASEKGVSVKPCSVSLTVAKPSKTVKTKGPDGGTFTVNDAGCTSRLIATVAGSGNVYTITAGSHGKGQCVATFIDYDTSGKRLGAAKVIIVNKVDEGG